MKTLTVVFCAFVLTINIRAAGPPPSSGANASEVPENLGLGLRQIVDLDRQDHAQARAAVSSSKSIMSDASGRVLVNINLDGTRAAADVGADLISLGLEITAVETSWRNGVISASLPISQAIAVAQLSGVRSVMLARRPTRRVGVVTAQSSVVERARDVNTPGLVTPQGLLGRNISVGIVSDSFDKAAGVARASVGVAAGDLPGSANPDGYTQPVVVLSDDSSSDVTDEGRAMAEIVHDIAPAAKICFSAAGGTQASMAASIRNLRTNSQTRCDIIADDISFPDEPFFSDGIITQAVEDVITSSSLAGRKVSYFSASGNNPGGYSADANIISFATANASRGNLQLTQVPSQLYAGGFQNLGTNAAPAVALSVTIGDSDDESFSFQWDDPFNSARVTTDYNLLVFDANGQYLANLSGTDNNQATDEPVEIVTLKKSTTYQIAISLRTSSPPPARHLRLVTQSGSASGPLISNTTMTIFGHSAAADANCVAAYEYSNAAEKVPNYNPDKTNPPPGPYEAAIESFDAVGGNMPFYFNAQGQRLANPEIRVKPDFAAADGVDTSFFPSDHDADTDNDGYPNFFGTSAAAPNAAAIAALLLEAAGGPSSLTPAQVRSTLQQSTFLHDADRNFSQASASSGSASVQVTASGDDSNASSASSTFFTVMFNGQAGETLRELTIDLTSPSLVFDQSSDLGFPFTVGSNSGGVSVSSSLSADGRALTLSFGSSFTPGKSISFGIDRDLAGINAGGNSADYLGGALITAVTGASQTFYGAFVNQFDNAFANTDGYGLVDAKAAVQTIVGASVGVTGVPANLSTRGLVGTNDSVLIGGVIINGNAPKNVVIRAIGPTLPLAGSLADPTLELVDANGQRFTNDNWQDDPSQAAQISSLGLAPSDPRESAILKSLYPGAYTAIISGVGNSSGVALVEVYDIDNQSTASHLANISTRGNVQAGDNVLIGGFILTRAATPVVVRALGPSLAARGVNGVLPDPAVELYDASGNVLIANDNWQQDAFQAAQLQTLGLAPSDPLESALVITLDAAAYTLIVRGSHETTGIGLVEVYDLP